MNKIERNNNRRKIAIDLQNACAESPDGLDIIYSLLLDYVPTEILKEELKIAKQTKEVA
jgi:hypothetical protein